MSRQPHKPTPTGHPQPESFWSVLGEYYTRAREIFSGEVDVLNAPPGQKFAVKTALIVRGLSVDLASGRFNLWAMSLVYTTLLSLVPLLAISFSVLKGFGAHNQIRPFLLNALATLGDKAEDVTDQIVAFVDNTQVGVLGFIGVAFLFYTVLSLMQKVEEAFNAVWRVNRKRSWTQQFRDYLSVIVVGPALIFLSLGAVASIIGDPALETVSRSPFLTQVLEFLRTLLPTVLVIIAFTFIYIFTPNTPVHVRSAMIGGTVAGILWNVLGWIFAAFVATSVSYSTIYSGFATPIIFMVWLYMGWLILLIGATIAFYHQNPDYALQGGAEVDLSNRAKERLSVLVAAEVGRGLYEPGEPVTVDAISRRLKVPMTALNVIIDILEQGGVITETGHNPPRYVPARPWDTTKVKDLIGLVRTSGVRPPVDMGSVMSSTRINEVFSGIEEAIASAAGDLTLKDLAIDGGVAEPAPADTVATAGDRSPTDT